MSYLQMLLVVCPLVFLAGFIDAIAGGGGLLSLPAFLFTGLPVHQCYGTNKFASVLGTSTAAARFYKSKAMDLRAALISAGFALVGGFAGTQVALRLDPKFLKVIFLFVLPVMAVFVLFFSSKSRQRKELRGGTTLVLLCAAIGFFIGAYDGLIGPGTGTMLIFAYTTFIGYDYVTSSGNAKIVNLASNLASVVAFLLAGKVLFELAIPAAVCSIAGGYLGSGMAIKKGNALVRKLLIVMLAFIFLKLLYDVFAGV